ncbi:MAG: DUF1003 domain-containing protein [Planctomycetota bacterium]
MKRQIELLKQASLFSDMDDTELAAMRVVMEEHSFVPGQNIIRENEDGKHVFVIVGGSADIFITDASGQELFLEKIGAGDLFGEMSMLTGNPRMVCVRAVDEVKTLTLSRTQFHDVLMKHPHAAIDVLTVVSKRLYTTDKLLRQSVSRNVNEVIEEKSTIGQMIADRFASTMGSWNFIIIQSLLLITWVLYNSLAPESMRFDTYPFIFLNLALSFQAAYAAPIIMMSQNRSSDKDRLAAEIDHQVNVKAEIKTGLIMSRLGDLEKSMHYLHGELLEHMGKGEAK